MSTETNVQRLKNQTTEIFQKKRLKQRAVIKLTLSIHTHFSEHLLLECGLFCIHFHPWHLRISTVYFFVFIRRMKHLFFNYFDCFECKVHFYCEILREFSI